MIDHLHIRNFRLFEDLQLNGLKQVNLFAGKNNTGKTFLLEALRIWAAQGDPTVINHLLAQRGQFTPGWDESYDALFYRPGLAAQKEDEEFYLTINQLSIYRKKSAQYRTYSQLFWNNTPQEPALSPNIPPDYPRGQAIFVPFGKEQSFPIISLWDKIVLTELEDEVEKILKETVLPDLVRLDVNKERTLVRIAGESQPLPLQTFGDGVSRMLMLAVALVSAKNKLLLIDEIEAGLHHSVMDLFWDKIFFYAQQWNIQVFATTHSHDTLKMFTYVLDKSASTGKGTFFRLQQARKTGKIEAVEYALEDLELSLESNLEPR
jgi:AAA15 family ATPase/GTPase